MTNHSTPGQILAHGVRELLHPKTSCCFMEHVLMCTVDSDVLYLEYLFHVESSQSPYCGFKKTEFSEQKVPMTKDCLPFP